MPITRNCVLKKREESDENWTCGSKAQGGILFDYVLSNKKLFNFNGSHGIACERQR